VGTARRWSDLQTRPTAAGIRAVAGFPVHIEMHAGGRMQAVKEHRSLTGPRRLVRDRIAANCAVMLGQLRRVVYMLVGSHTAKLHR
jgi:hypothetical protein